MKKSLNTGIVLFALAISIIVFNLCLTTQARAQIADTTTVTKKQPYKLLYYIYNTQQDTYELCTADYDGANVQHRIHIKTVPNGNMLKAYPLAISPDHKTIFFTSCITEHRDYVNQLYACNTDGSNRHPLPVITSILSFVAYAPVIKRQPYKLVYFTCNDYVHIKMYKADYNGKNPKRIYIHLPKGKQLDCTFLAVSPDRKTVFFNSVRSKNDDSFFQPYACNLDGSHLHPVPAGQIVTLLAYAPATETASCKLLYFDVGDINEPRKLYTANCDGTNPRRIYINLPEGTLLGDFPFAISPDHKTIIFNSYTYGEGKEFNQLYACNLDGSNLHPIIGGNVLGLVAY